jgi:hypothetical protein
MLSFLFQLPHQPITAVLRHRWTVYALFKVYLSGSAKPKNVRGNGQTLYLTEEAIAINNNIPAIIAPSVPNICDMQNITPPANIVDTNIYHPVPFLTLDKPLPLTAPCKNAGSCGLLMFCSSLIALNFIPSP